ncbi:hypothetical protein Tco_1307344, partial [Tanacetum coccineum]
SKKTKKKKIWKPTGKVFNEIGLKWKPTSRFFTIDGNRCPLTRITSTIVMSLKETTSVSKIKVYSRRPIALRIVGTNKNSKTSSSEISNHAEPNQSWGYIVFDVPSSSLDICSLSKSSSGIWTSVALST